MEIFSTDISANIKCLYSLHVHRKSSSTLLSCVTELHAAFIEMEYAAICSGLDQAVLVLHLNQNNKLQ